MFEFIADIQETDNNMKLINEALKELKSTEVLVGIPQEESSRKNDEITNAELLYIHTNGSPIRNIPSRPVIEPAIVDDKENISALLKAASQKVLDGDKEGMKQELEKAGMHGENVSKAWFTNPKNGWKPNSEVTIEGTKSGADGKKFIKGKRKRESDTIFNPLIDTGEMRKSITYIVRRKST